MLRAGVVDGVDPEAQRDQRRVLPEGPRVSVQLDGHHVLAGRDVLEHGGGLPE